MKSIKKKRILALVLCMVLMLSSSISAMASSVAEEPPVTESTADLEAAAGEGTSENAEAGDTTDTAPTGDDSAAGTEDLVGGAALQEPEVKETTEAAETTEPEEESEEEVLSEAAELRQEFTDENGKVVERVTANLPEGAFNAKASEITMEVNYPEEAMEKHLRDLMTKALPENNILGDYILYDIRFKVNGVVTESQKPVTITFEGSGLHIEDTEKANVFCLDPADPEVKSDQDKIVEITQKSEMLEALKQAGQSTENIDEYDLSEIRVKEDKTADKITLEGRTSNVYGCYVEELSKERVFEEVVDGVTVKVTAPEGCFTIKSDDVTMTAAKVSGERLEEIKQQLNIKAEEEGKEVLDFLVYDINLWANGENIQPNIPVTVTFENTQLRAETTAEATGFQLDESNNVNVMEGTIDVEATATLEAEHFTETGIMLTSLNAKSLENKAVGQGIQIIDDIINTGTLQVKLSSGLEQNIEWYRGQGYSVKFVWYKSINEGQFKKIEPVKVGDDYSINDNGTRLNVAYDKGALSSDNGYKTVRYKVGVVVGTSSLAMSDAFSVPYWNELQNGSFENPQFYYNVTNQIQNGYYPEMVWKTTGIGQGKFINKDIEIVSLRGNPNLAIYSWQGEKKAAEGYQFAELNCEAAGALYQDVLTVEGEPLNYWLSHRARGKNANWVEEDTMYVVIIPTSVALDGVYHDGDPIDTQREVNFLMEHIESYPGAFVEKYTSDDQAWHRYTGKYKAASYLTRIFFVAGETASGDDTVGNFLDDVGFSQKLPPANPGYFNLQIQKEISGLSKDEYVRLKDTLQFKITTGNNLPLNNTTIRANAKEWTWTSNPGGTYTGVYNITTQLPPYHYGSLSCTITETNGMVSGYNLESSVTVNGIEQSITDDNISGKAQIQDKSSAAFVFTNNYTEPPSPEPDIEEGGDVPHSKYIDYLGDGVENPDTELSGNEFNRLYLDATGIPDQDVKAADVIFVLDASNSMSFAMGKEEPPARNDTDQETRMDKLKTATKTAVNALMEGNDNINVSVIPFHSWINTEGDNTPLLNITSKADIINYIDIKLKPEKQVGDNRAGGTNYQAAFESTQKVLDSLKNNGHRKYVVFVSDGVPTFYNNSAGNWVWDENQAPAESIKAAKKFTKNVALNGFYTVSVGPGADYLEKSITPCPSAAHREWINGTNTNDLNNAFIRIAGSITKQIANVTIEDTLSEYVDFVRDNLGRVNESTIELKVTKKRPGAETCEVLDPKDYTCSIDSLGKKISVNFGETCFFERDAVYTISFNVKTTQKVYTASAADIGDADTDYPGNLTSSNQPGFFSNKGATITYSRVTDNVYKEETKDYSKPVVQPYVSHSVNKVWNGNPAAAIDVQLKAAIRDGDKITDVSGDVLTKVSDAAVTLDDSKEWQYKWDSLPQNYYPQTDGKGGESLRIIYTVEETKISQKPGEMRTYHTTTTESDDGLTTTITNSETYKWQVIKKSTSAGNPVVKGAEFQLKSSDKTYHGSSNDKGIIVWDGLADSSEIDPGEYTFEEVKAPAGYALSKDVWTVNIEYKGAIPSIANRGETIAFVENSHNKGVYEWIFLNTPLYELPSTGGIGIFWYIIGGILLMMAGVLILYKNKYREVLKK